MLPSLQIQGTKHAIFFSFSQIKSNVFSHTHLYINLRRSRDGAFVRAVVAFGWNSGVLDSFSSLWAAFMLCTSTHCQYNEIVHRKQQHTSEINTIA